MDCLRFYVAVMDVCLLMFYLHALNAPEVASFVCFFGWFYPLLELFLEHYLFFVSMSFLGWLWLVQIHFLSFFSRWVCPLSSWDMALEACIVFLISFIS